MKRSGPLVSDGGHAQAQHRRRGPPGGDIELGERGRRCADVWDLGSTGQ
jgi:hypothetical protein